MLTNEHVRAAGGIVHGDGNIFFTNIDKLNEATAPLLERIAELEAKLAQRVPDVDALTDKIASLLGLTYHCNRVWDAWNVGTMSQDDFEPVDESETPREIAEEIHAMLSAAPAAPEQQEPTSPCACRPGMMCNRSATCADEIRRDAQASNAQQAEPRDAHFGGSSYEASMLRNLLARIHGDGGHYVAQHGLEKAMEDADQLCAKWRAQQAEAQELTMAIPQFRKARCSDWYDGFPDYEDSGGPYETRVLFTRPQPAQLQALSEEEVKAAATKSVASGKLVWLGFEKDADGSYTVPVLSPSDLKFSEAIQSAIAAKNGVNLK